jgi:hypothetical protein
MINSLVNSLLEQLPGRLLHCMDCSEINGHKEIDKGELIQIIKKDGA